MTNRLQKQQQYRSRVAKARRVIGTALRRARLTAAILLASVCIVGQADPQSVARGEYIYHLAGCENCHTDRKADGPLLAGGLAFETPFGTFFSPNITPDPDTGIGAWSLSDFRRALREGKAPGGDFYYPVFPYPSYRGMSDQDIADLFEYLQQREPIRRDNRSHDVPFYLPRQAMWVWNLINLGDDARDSTNLDPQRRRGAYIVDSLAHCGECHTPRNLMGAMDASRYLGGNPEGPEGESVPNITPHKQDGIGRWGKADLDYFLQTGALPDGDYTGSLMADVIDHGTSFLVTSDRAAVVDYLMAVPALPDSIGR